MGLIKGRFIFWAAGAQGQGISGGDRIFIELARRWSGKHKVKIIVCEDGYKICEKQGITKGQIRFKVIKLGIWNKMGFLISYFFRILLGIHQSLLFRANIAEKTFIYSASEFWMDCIPCFILKLRYPSLKWIASWYQTAPNPIIGYSEITGVPRYRIRAFVYWLMQLFSKPIISRFADYIFVNNEDEKKIFNKKNEAGRVFVMLGAIDTVGIRTWIKSHKISQKYDAVFQGRFHAQKGVLELVKIWKMVVKIKPTVQLAMIGDGPLFEEVKREINRLRINKNIKLFGFIFDNNEKYKIFCQSRIVVHPSFYDSGGISSIEAMAFGLPCVGFQLSSYNSYFPQGMIKARKGDLKDFAGKIIRFLEDRNYRLLMSKEGNKYLAGGWSWEERADQAEKFLIQK